LRQNAGFVLLGAHRPSVGTEDRPAYGRIGHGGYAAPRSVSRRYCVGNTSGKLTDKAAIR
jgi:hypothetical protein